jgi:eukaryotic-like serine/threonine-protein kinase
MVQGPAQGVASAGPAWQGLGVSRSKSPDRIGQVIASRYELVDIIGRGGQGTVYRAKDQWAAREVAVKVLGSKAAREAQMVERLMREQQALSVLKGTSAVELFDLCRGNDGELCLVMELLTGIDLDEQLDRLAQRNERMRLERVGEIFDPIVRTLETAHAAGILHRDLKPANIFLLEGGGVRLLDFGLARLKNAAPLTAAGMVMGSPSFMAPEAWKGISDLLDPRVDVYSLGVILYLVLTGELPFSGSTIQDIFLGTTTGKRPSMRKVRPDLPRRADEWATRALAVNRDERFESVRALWQAFCTTFHVHPPSRPSLWAKAKGAVQKIASHSQPAPPAPAPVPHVPGAPKQPSFDHEALAATAFHIDPSTSDEKPPPKANKADNARKPAADTLYISGSDLLPVEQPKRPPPPPRQVEKTLSISAEIIAEPDAPPREKK